MGIVDTVKREFSGDPPHPGGAREKVAVHRLNSRRGEHRGEQHGLRGGRGDPLSATRATAVTSPRRCRGRGARPPRSVAVLCEDPDAPFPSPFVHWLVHGLPAMVHSLPEGVGKSATVPGVPAAHQGSNGHDTG
ncbi:MAG: hypothetical protein IPN17_37260 [Deltaproteobacteria bacterium]|nr:hypothetical protein [Deltaproteobacteria bacterium]